MVTAVASSGGTPGISTPPRKPEEREILVVGNIMLHRDPGSATSFEGSLTEMMPVMDVMIAQHSTDEHSDHRIAPAIRVSCTFSDLDGQSIRAEFPYVAGDMESTLDYVRQVDRLYEKSAGRAAAQREWAALKDAEGAWRDRYRKTVSEEKWSVAILGAIGAVGVGTSLWLGYQKSQVPRTKWDTTAGRYGFPIFLGTVSAIIGGVGLYYGLTGGPESTAIKSGLEGIQKRKGEVQPFLGVERSEGGLGAISMGVSGHF